MKSIDASLKVITGLALVILASDFASAGNLAAVSIQPGSICSHVVQQGSLP